MHQEQILLRHWCMTKLADVDHQQAARNSIVELLDIGNRKAQCVVLELAMWKFLCTIQCPGNVSGILELSEWSR
jgi:hypothetical protein